MDLRRLKKYCVDIVFCIDTTGSMSPIIRSVKKYAVDFYDKVHFEMELQGKQVDLLRVKVISFRDFACDGEEALKQSDFFVLDRNNYSGRKETFYELPPVLNSLLPEEEYGVIDDPGGVLIFYRRATGTQPAAR